MEKVGLEISVSEDFTSACIQPEVYDQLVELGIEVGAPILVPSGLELFEDIDAYVGVSYCAVGNDPTQIPALDTAQLVSGFIGDQNHRDCRYLVVAEILELHPIDNTDDFVLASVMLDKWSEAFVVLSSEISPHVHERSIIWCACDKVDSMAEFSQLNRSSPNKLHALFRVGLNLASQYTPV
ncbi:MAG: hypothetical protein Q4A92_08975, partial [Corynebacterium sp.]|nr:hypothetical protein [Corynebacterium sp.]